MTESERWAMKALQCSILADTEETNADMRSKVMAYIEELKAQLTAAEKRATEAEARLPEGMKHCTIQFKQCEKGHGWLTATNWVQHGCPTCREEVIKAEATELASKCAEMELTLDDISESVPVAEGITQAKLPADFMCHLANYAICNRPKRLQAIAEILALCPIVADLLWHTIMREGSSVEKIREKFRKAVATLNEKEPKNE